MKNRARRIWLYLAAWLSLVAGACWLPFAPFGDLGTTTSIWLTLSSLAAVWCGALLGVAVAGMIELGRFSAAYLMVVGIVLLIAVGTVAGYALGSSILVPLPTASLVIGSIAGMGLKCGATSGLGDGALTDSLRRVARVTEMMNQAVCAIVLVAFVAGVIGMLLMLCLLARVTAQR